jgi:hypothetical protein
MYVLVCTHVNIHVGMHVNVRVGMHVNVRVGMHVNVRVGMHTYPSNEAIMHMPHSRSLCFPTNQQKTEFLSSSQSESFV